MGWYELAQYGLLVALGVGCGFLNTVAGGGSLIAMATLIFMGLPGTVANGTNRLAILAQTILASRGFAKKGVALPVPYAYYLSIATLAGSLIGVFLALVVPSASFNKILSLVMVFVLILMWGNTARPQGEQKEKMTVWRQVWGNAIFFLLGIYAGFIQAGVGLIAVVTLSYLHNLSLVKSNYIKVFVGILCTGVAVVIFAWEHQIEWGWGIALSVGQGVGAWSASIWSVKKGDKWIKRILIIAIVPMAIKLWFF